MNCGTIYGFGQHKAKNEPACKFCKAAKAKHDAGIVVVAAPSKKRVAQCGTASGAKKHRREDTTICQPCRDAENGKARENKAKKRTPRVAGGPKPAPREPKPPRPVRHGTTAGYQAHKRRDEQPCEPCLEALREKSKKARASAPKKPRELIPCPSNAAYLRHLKAGEEACAPCKEDQRLRAKEKRARKIEREGGPRPHAGRKPINHGTTAGRVQHMRRGETPCDPCKAAFNAYNRQYSASARKKAKAQA